MFATLKQFLKNQIGVTAIEYAAISAIIGVALITVINSVGSGLTNTFGNVATNL